MNNLGTINNREIFYISAFNNPDWFKLLPTDKWVVFTITDNENRDILDDITSKIIDKNVLYTCSAGELAGLTEEYFDEEIVLRAVSFEQTHSQKYDYDQSPVTTMHSNFSEGFWYVTFCAYHETKPTEKVICIDFTSRKVKKHLVNLIHKINNGWLPNEEEFELPVYDT